MFEFLKDSSEILYCRGRDIECNLNSFSPYTSMRSFIEVALKIAYKVYNKGLDQGIIDRFQLTRLLNEREFKNWYINKYHFTNFFDLDEIIRRGGNKGTHSAYYQVDNPLKVKEAFKLVFTFAAKWHAITANVEEPQWSEEDYKSLCDKLVSFDSREDSVTQNAPLIAKKNEEYDEVYKELIEIRKENVKLKKELEDLKTSSISPEVLEESKGKIKTLNETINRIANESATDKAKLLETEEQLRVAKDEIDRINRRLKRESFASDDMKETLLKSLEEANKRYTNALKESKRLNNEINRLKDEIRGLSESYQAEINKLEELKNNSVDKAAYLALKEKLDAAEIRFNDIYAKYERILGEKEELEKKLYLTDDKIDSELEKQQNNQIEIDKNNSRIEELLEYAPRCAECGARMEPYQSQYSNKVLWKCPRYPTCTAKMKYISEFADLGKHILELNKGAVGSYIPKLPASTVKSKTNTKFNASYYPESLDKSLKINCLFETLALPLDFIDKYESENLLKYSRFSLLSSTQKSFLEPKDKIVYSLILKLLNRGYVIPSSYISDEYIEQRFSKDITCSADSLYRNTVYSNPSFIFRNDAEKEILSKFFRNTFGGFWANFITKDAPSDILLPNDTARGVSKFKVDYLISKYAAKRAVIVIDGSLSEQRIRLLENNKYKVFQVKSEDLTNRKSSFFAEFQEYFKPVKPQSPYGNIQYVISHKIVHQLSVSIAKLLEQGVINGDFKLDVHGSIPSLTDDDLRYLLFISIIELKQLVQNYSKIYGFDTNFKLKADCNNPDFVIYIGDGSEEPNTATIRDISLDFNFQPSIAPMSLDYLPIKSDADALRFFLKYIFGFDDFREGQLVAIDRLLGRKDSIILLPTGAGKSIIYQLVSLIVPGLVIVISPLVSLIEDQLFNLSDRYGITTAVSITSATSEEEKARKVESIRVMKNNSSSLLYISPERLQVESFRVQIEKLLVANNVFAIAIDEAHCVSEWGHDFRPSYLNIGNLSRRLFKKGDYVPPLLALTGTASEAVLSDVQRDLNISSPNAIIRPNTFDRSELHFSIETCESTNKIIYIGNYIKNVLPESFGQSYDDFSVRRGNETISGIVFTPYATSKRGGHYFADSLHYAFRNMFPEMGVGCYFSKVPGMYDEQAWKATIREYAKRFKNNELNMLVATKAYGMGIDKSNIRFTIHDGIPSSIEQYYQEAGRAGRDRRQSECVLVFSENDADKNEEFLKPGLTLTELTKLYDSMPRDEHDDLNIILFFHVKTFEGIESEYSVVASIMDDLSKTEFIKGGHTQFILPPTDEKNKDDVEKKYISAMIRLVMLGIIKDYTYNYNSLFSITLGSMDKEDIINAYDAYVTSFRKGRSVSERRKLEESTEEGWDFAKYAAHVLIEYVYDFIEQGRRAEIRNMYNLAKSASLVEKERQDSYVREQINNYFTFRDEVKDELNQILSADNAGFDYIQKVFPFHVDKLVLNDDEQEKAISYVPVIDRLLESQPDHPGLLILRAVADMKSGRSIHRNVVEYVVAGFRYALDRYSVSEESCLNLLVRVLNLASRISIKLYQDIVDELHKNELATKSLIVKEMMESELVNNDFRNYLTFEYIEHFYLNKGEENL